jgi:hypothetical protein
MGADGGAAIVSVIQKDQKAANQLPRRMSLRRGRGKPLLTWRLPMFGYGTIIEVLQ